MASTQKRPKGILKKPSSFPTRSDAPLASQTDPTALPSFVPPPSKPSPSPLAMDAPQPTTPDRAARNRQLAVQHATILQQRKDTETLILANLEELMDFPTAPSPAFTAARPAPADLARFQALIPPFNTADYDALLAERTCCDRCAYVFCPVRLSSLARDRAARANVNRLRYDGARWNSVKQAKLDQWCSAACARRGLYVRVQLSETPAWERAGLAGGGAVELLREGDDGVLEAKMQGLRMDAVASGREADGMDVELDTTGLEDEKRRRDDAELLQAAMEELALERGDARAESSRRGVVVKETLVENPARMGAGAPRLVSASEAVEGYVPRAQRGILRRQKAEGEESDEEEDTDWQL